MTFDAAKDSFTVRVRVTNTGDIAGKEVVQVYGQQPYTQFDKENAIEKASVQLVGFGKTKELAPDAEEIVEVKVERKEPASYDAAVNKTYILESGDYYLSVGANAHDALNNILAKKGFGVKDGMDAEGDAKMVYEFNVDKTDTTTYAYSETNKGVKITNQFDAADLNYYGDGLVTWLTRSDWQGTFPTSHDDLTATSKMIQDLQFNYEPDTSKSDITLGSEETQYSIVMMRGKDYDDPIWQDLLDQLTLEEMAEIVGHSGYGTQAISSTNLPSTVQADGPQGIKGTYAGSSTVAYTSEPVMASTFNVEILYAIGLSMGGDALRIDGTRISGRYGPAMNIHRTPYSGRNFEYYSEDSFLSGVMAAQEVSAAQSMGLCCYIKHFALNDFETYRQSVATFVPEQAIREIYLKGFRYAVEDGGATAIMTSFNRIGTRWTGGDYRLLTTILRDEWGFEGAVICDFNSSSYMNTKQMAYAGGDLNLANVPMRTKEWADTSSAADITILRQCTKNILFATANSNAINRDIEGYLPPVWQIVMFVVDGVIAAGLLVWGVLAVRGALKRQKAQETAKQ